MPGTAFPWPGGRTIRKAPRRPNLPLFFFQNRNVFGRFSVPAPLSFGQLSRMENPSPIRYGCGRRIGLLLPTSLCGRLPWPSSWPGTMHAVIYLLRLRLQADKRRRILHRRPRSGARFPRGQDIYALAANESLPFPTTESFGGVSNPWHVLRVLTCPETSGSRLA